MFDSCLRLAPNHLLRRLVFCVSKRTLGSTRASVSFISSPRLVSDCLLFLRRLLRSAQNQRQDTGKGAYLRRCARITLPRQTFFHRPSASSSVRNPRARGALVSVLFHLNGLNGGRRWWFALLVLGTRS